MKGSISDASCRRRIGTPSSMRFIKKCKHTDKNETIIRQHVWPCIGSGIRLSAYARRTAVFLGGQKAMSYPEIATVALGRWSWRIVCPKRRIVFAWFILSGGTNQATHGNAFWYTFHTRVQFPPSPLDSPSTHSVRSGSLVASHLPWITTQYVILWKRGECPAIRLAMRGMAHVPRTGATSIERSRMGKKYVFCIYVGK